MKALEFRRFGKEAGGRGRGMKLTFVRPAIGVEKGSACLLEV